MRSTLFAVCTATSLFLVMSPAVHADTLSLMSFARETGINADQGKLQSTWNDLHAMGTTKFLGGMLGNFKLDESSMLAGALTIGVTEFDRFLKSGTLDISGSNIGSVLSSKISAAAGINMSTITGSFTQNGGPLSQHAASLTSSGAASAGNSYCDPSVAQDLVNASTKYVEDAVAIASSDEYGFSQLSKGGAGNSGFAGMSCLDKLFQNAGSDIMFKPPSLGSLTSQLQNWSCPEATSIMDQVAGAFSPSSLQTASLGGFFPHLTMPDSGDMAPIKRPGMGGEAAIFGDGFNKIARVSQQEIKNSNILSIFK